MRYACGSANRHESDVEEADGSTLGGFGKADHAAGQAPAGVAGRRRDLVVGTRAHDECVAGPGFAMSWMLRVTASKPRMSAQSSPAIWRMAATSCLFAATIRSWHNDLATLSDASGNGCVASLFA